MLNARLWKICRSRWRKPSPATRAPGYTLLMMLPADLPVFMRLAMQTCAAQDATGRVETLVIGDKPSAEFTRQFEDAARNWPGGPIRLVNLRGIERWVTGRRRGSSPHTNYWLQVINGLEECTTTHALLHDADLFFTQKDFLASHYAACAGGHWAVMGIHRVWDKWFAQHELEHVTATWEMMLEVEWARSFAPWQHRGQAATINGQKHVCDTLLLPQCLTEPKRIGRRGDDRGMIHFNYVIGTYRWFAQSRRTFSDDYFRILLIRLLSDALGCSHGAGAAPALVELQRAIATPGRVSYAGAEAKKNYAEFRAKLQMLMDARVLDDGQNGILREGVRLFDEAFGEAK